MLTIIEQQQIQAAANSYNAIIQEAAQRHDIPVADINGLFNRFAAPGGYRVGPFTLNSSFISGGIFSFDAFHLTDIGYMLFANQYIRTINDAYDTEIPVASIGALFLANNYPEATTTSGARVFEGMEWTMSVEAVKTIQRYGEPLSRRYRSIGH